MSLVALGTTVNIPPGEAVHQHRHGFRWSWSRRWLVQKAPASRELQRATAIAQEAIVPNTHEALGQDVQEEAPHEFLHFQSHDVMGVSPVRVAPPEGDL